MNSAIHFLSSESHFSKRFLKMWATPFGASSALMSGTATNTTPITRCAMRSTNTTSLPASCVSAGTNTNKPLIANKMQLITVMPCVMRACFDLRRMRTSVPFASRSSRNWRLEAYCF